ncbi:hypothetical protein JN086_18765 [Mycolicibacterium austroafricanum]|nr:hypothetical protein JN086_18765 [Mycolicibacterium austroafricanum]QZY44474.1 hypothetical protein K5L12_19675 [Mycolicibacterium austroafricanum]
MVTACTAGASEADEPGVAAVAALLTGQDSVSAAAAVAEQQAAAAAVLARCAVGPVAEQQSAVLARFVTVADEDPDDAGDRVDCIGSGG